MYKCVAYQEQPFVVFLAAANYRALLFEGERTSTLTLNQIAFPFTAIDL